ncbi:N-6 DNA methylase [Micromonospora sp. LOL_025]|uniref:N-6 DNA methylase n=1 Tax=Micromonospora sp. LOL_025 TaxID=3345413 RepID=UPI003A87CB46
MTPVPPDTVTRSQIAAAVCVTEQAVSNWIRRYADFPRPSSTGRTHTYPTALVAEWFDRQHGTTYGDRFRKAIHGHDTRHRTNSAILIDAQWSAPLEGLMLRSSDAWLFERLVLTLVHAKHARATTAAAYFTARIRTTFKDPWWRNAVTEIDAVLSERRQPPHLIFDHLLDRFAKARHKTLDQYLVPTEIAQLMVRLVDPRPGNRVHDPCCGTAGLLVAAAEHMSRASTELAVVSGRAATKRTRHIATMNLAVHGYRAAISDDTAAGLSTVVAEPEQFDTILLNPPFSREQWQPADDAQSWPYGKPNHHNTGLAWLQAAALSLAPGGRAAVIMPASATEASSTRDQNVRAAMVEAGVIRCVIQLREHMFREAKTAVSIWMLGHPDDAQSDVLLIDASAATRRTEKTHWALTGDGIETIVGVYRNWQNGEVLTPARAGVDAVSVSIPELRDNDYVLQVDAGRPRARPLPRTDGTMDTLLGLVPDDWQNRPLGDFCEVQPGVSGETLPPSKKAAGGVPVVTATNVRNDEIATAPKFTVSSATAAGLDRRYRIHAGDVLLVRVGKTSRTAVADDQHSGWLVGNTCIRVRAKEGIRAEYLAWYLTHPGVREWIVARTLPGVKPSINAKIIKSMPLVVPPTEQQRNLAGTVPKL